jgi:serine/threonine protein phosphatase PrpC
VAAFFKRLFHNKTSGEASLNPENQPVVKISDRRNITPTEPQESPSPQVKAHLDVAQLLVGVAQSIGIQRDHNEDSLYTLTTNLLVDEKSINFGLYIIADGMGGHDNGELASRLAVDRLVSHVINALYLLLISSSNSTHEVSLQEVMQAGVLKAHEAIKKATDGGGTTLTAALFLGDQCTISHVGDSRAYYSDPLGNIKLITRDHTLVKRLQEIGQISSYEALTHPQRNVLYRALGQGEPFEPDISSFQVCPGCQLLICSDGLWGVIPEEDLAQILCSSMDPQLACQTLVNYANQAGGPDNISVIIVRLSE